MANKKYESIKISEFKKLRPAIGGTQDSSLRSFSGMGKCFTCAPQEHTFLYHKKLTPFAKNVYRAVLSIPIGEVRSYKWVAQKTGKPRAARAVGQILKNNPWPLIIPCHRVICADGKLGGYGPGEKKKKNLLDLEKQIIEDMV